MPDNPKKTSLSVLIAEDYLDRVSEVVERLRGAGLEVQGVQEGIGAVSGSIDAARLEDLSGIDGVAAVERSQDYQLPPPEADVQ